ncbi:DUF4178 domain-containing protein [Candidatus Riflebacteria bacterium]
MQFQRQIQVASLYCPNCGDSIELKTGPKSKSYTCLACGALLDTSKEPLSVLQIFENAKEHKAKSHLRLGLRGTLEKLPFEIVGRIRYQAWDDEDTWTWDEWQLQSPMGKFKWLQEDESGFILFDRFIPKNPVSLNQILPKSIKLEQFNTQIIEVASSKIAFVEGELTWQPDLGEKVKYADAYFHPFFYTIEQSETEIQFFKGKGYSAKAVYKAFGLSPDLAPDLPAPINPAIHYGIDDEDDDEDWEEEGDGAYGTIGGYFLGFGFILVLTGLFLGRFGSNIASYSAKLADVSDETQLFGPIKMAGSRIHLLKISTSEIPNNTWLAGDVALLNEKKEPVMHLTIDFWDETGYDDGYWHENDLSHSEYFIPFSKNQEYFLEMAGEGDSGAKGRNPTLTLSMYSGVFENSAFYILGGILIFLSFLVLGDWDSD